MRAAPNGDDRGYGVLPRRLLLRAPVDEARPPRPPGEAPPRRVDAAPRPPDDALLPRVPDAGVRRPPAVPRAPIGAVPDRPREDADLRAVLLLAERRMPVEVPAARLRAETALRTVLRLPEGRTPDDVLPARLRAAAVLRVVLLTDEPRLLVDALAERLAPEVDVRALFLAAVLLPPDDKPARPPMLEPRCDPDRSLDKLSAFLRVAFSPSERCALPSSTASVVASSLRPSVVVSRIDSSEVSPKCRPWRVGVMRVLLSVVG